MKILILGHARHGKDTVAEMLKQEYGINFLSSSEAATKIFIYEALKEKYGYANFRVCYEDRINHRKEWHDLIVDYNKEDASKLAKEILKENDCYVGMRSNREFLECKKNNLFDLVIGVYNPRVPEEDKDSFDIDFLSSCDLIISNNGSIDDLRTKILNLLCFVKPYTYTLQKPEKQDAMTYIDWASIPTKGFN